MNILYLISSFEGGGAGYSIPALKDVFAAEGHNVRVVALEPKDNRTAELLDEHNIPNDVLYEPHPERSYLYKKLHEWTCNSRPVKLYHVYKLLKYLRTHPTDLIWCSLNQACFVGALVGAIKGIPSIGFKQSDILHLYTKLTWKLPKFWVSDSLAMQKWTAEVSGLPESKVLNWPIFIANPDLPAAKIPHGETFNLLSIGRLNKMKNYDTLMKAIGIVKERYPETYKKLHLSIISEGPAREELEGLISSLDISEKVTLKGYVSLEELQETIVNSDLYLQPSRNEGMCITLHEAMSQGLPAIVSPVGQMQYTVVNHENGLVLEENTASCLADAIHEMLKDPKELARMGKNARKMILETYSQENFVRNGKKVIKEFTS